jgi:mannosyltransferase
MNIKVSGKFAYPTLLAILVLAGTVLRFYNVDRESLWFDELATWETSRSDIIFTKNPLNSFSFDKEYLNPPPGDPIQQIAAIIANAQAEKVHLPLYFILVFFIKSSIGDSELSLRLLSLISGILSIVILYRLSKLFFCRKTAIISAAFISLLWFPVYYSREARMYMLMVLFSILSTYLVSRFYFSAQKGKPVYRWMILYFFSALFNAYLHFCSFYFTVIQSFAAFLFLWFQSRHSRKSLVFLMIFFSMQAAAIFPLGYYILSLFPSASNITNIQWIPKPGMDSFFLFFNSFLNYPKDKILTYYLPAFIRSSIVRDFILVSCSILFFLRYDSWIKQRASLASIIKRIFDCRQREFFFLLWLLLPLFLLFLISVFIEPLYLDRYIIFALPPLYILIARIIVVCGKYKWIPFVFTIIFSGLAVYDLLVVKDYYHNPNKMQYREAMSYIAERSGGKNDFFIAANQGNFGIEYYQNRFSLGTVPCISLQHFYSGDYNRIDFSQYPPEAANEITRLLAYINSGKYRFMWYLNIWEFVENFEIRGMKKLYTVSFFKVHISLYELRTDEMNQFELQPALPVR